MVKRLAALVILLGVVPALPLALIMFLQEVKWPLG
ncbi:hypothetical protein VIF_002521 [Vibrio cholerae TM 11079-80]|nr:hypothetical protein VIF_002521 [Vibrio cholerae TM 11079-80]